MPNIYVILMFVAFGLIKLHILFNFFVPDKYNIQCLFSPLFAKPGSHSNFSKFRHIFFLKNFQDKNEICKNLSLEMFGHVVVLPNHLIFNYNFALFGPFWSRLKYFFFISQKNATITTHTHNIVCVCF